jgi:chaperonin cofactor prefoldin
MVSNMDALPERVELIERKLDALSVSVDQRFNVVDERLEAINKRFDAADRRFDSFEASVIEHFIEQRQYTEFAFERLEKRLSAHDVRLARIEGHVADGAVRLERLERKLDQFIELYPPPRRSRSQKKA